MTTYSPAEVARLLALRDWTNKCLAELHGMGQLTWSDRTASELGKELLSTLDQLAALQAIAEKRRIVIADMNDKLGPTIGTPGHAYQRGINGEDRSMTMGPRTDSAAYTLYLLGRSVREALVDMEVTWCKDSVLACEVAYVRADLDAPIAQLKNES